MADIKITPKFPLVQPEIPQETPQETPQMTTAEMKAKINAETIEDLEAAGIEIPEKCKACENLTPCVMLQIVSGR
jgi:hypothetical protein